MATAVTGEDDGGNFLCALCVIIILDDVPLRQHMHLHGARALPSAPDVSATTVASGKENNSNGAITPIDCSSWTILAHVNQWRKSDFCWRIVSGKWGEGGWVCCADTIV